MDDDASQPDHFTLPDLSDLDTNMIGAWVLTAALRIPYPTGPASMLLPTLVRSLETTIRVYETTRRRLERSASEDSLTEYMRGASDMELTFISLHRGVRLAEKLCELPETRVSKGELPPQAARDQIRKMRVAVEHIDDAIVREARAGEGETLAFNIRSEYTVVHDKDGVRQEVRHSDLGEWIRTLRTFAERLVHERAAWGLPSA